MLKNEFFTLDCVNKMSLVKFFTILVEIVFDLFFLKVISNSSSLNKGNHERDVIWINRFLRFSFDVFCLFFSFL